MPGVTEPPADASMEPEVHALRGTASLLIDRSHGQDGNISGFTDFLESEGWLVEEFESGPVSESALASCDVFLVPIRSSSPMSAFTAAEVAAVTDFVSDGGGLWLFHEFERDPSGINSVSGAFGVQFHNDIVRDSSDNEGQVFWPTIHLLADHPITEGVTSYGYYAGCCLTVGSPSIVTGAGDDDAFSTNCPTFPPTLATYESTGRVVFAGDISPLGPIRYPERLRDEEELLLQNIANWLARLNEPTSTTEASWGAVKRLYRR
jgi:hypothetical protein